MKSRKLKEWQSALAILRKGGVIAFPTETTYGLACDPRNHEAVKKIFAIKGRSEKKPLQLIASSKAEVKRLVKLTGKSKELADAFWPGPLTLLLPLKRGIHLAPEVSPDNIIGIRVTSGAFAKKNNTDLRISIRMYFGKSKRKQTSIFRKTSSRYV